MDKKRRLEIVHHIVTVLREECDLKDTLHILAVCTNFCLHKVPPDQRRVKFETWVHDLYEAEFALQRRFGDDDHSSQLPH